ncbi:MAG: helix-turn-helix domain-containing protein [Eubacteriaceae bacterium]
MRIKEIRREKKFSQKKLGEILKVNQSAISQWELGLTSPLASKLPLLAHTLECNIEDLYEDHEMNFSLE